MASAPTTEQLTEWITPLMDSGTVMRGKSVDVMWLLITGALVFFMQLGFALVEAGSVRAKNTKNILLKNILDCCIGALIWWSWGHALAVRAQSMRARRACAQRACHPLLRAPDSRPPCDQRGLTLHVPHHQPYPPSPRSTTREMASWA
jgi:hypothetical protein